MEELGIDELREIFEIDPRATRVRLFRARRRLRELLELGEADATRLLGRARA